MKGILQDINAVGGVTGCFVCGKQGELLASALPSGMDDAAVSVAARSVALAVAGARRVRRLSVNDISLRYVAASLVIKNLRHGCLCILCTPRINVSLLNLTVDVAMRKLSVLLRQRESDART